MTPSTNSRKRVAVATAERPPRNSGNRGRKRSGTPAGRGEKHLGATEDQVAVTMPPKADDDEPKQG